MEVPRLHWPLPPALQHLQNDPLGILASQVSHRSLSYGLHLSPDGNIQYVHPLLCMLLILRNRTENTEIHLHTHLRLQLDRSLMLHRPIFHPCNLQHNGSLWSCNQIPGYPSQDFFSPFSFPPFSIPIQVFYNFSLWNTGYTIIFTYFSTI